MLNPIDSHAAAQNLQNEGVNNFTPDNVTERNIPPSTDPIPQNRVSPADTSPAFGDSNPDVGTQRPATLTLPVSNENGIVCFEDILMELFRRHEVEKNAKNEAYHFILSHGHFDAYREFNRRNQGKNIDHHAESVQCLINMLPVES